MKPNRQLHACLWLSTFLLGALACGGGGGGGESFIVTGLWTTNATGGPPTPNPSDTSRAGQACNAAAAAVPGGLPATQINVVQQDSTATATEVGSGLAFTGTVNDADQSFTLTSSSTCVTEGSCQACGTFDTDFLNAAGNTADVNVLLTVTGVSPSCAGLACTLTFPPTTASRS